MNAEFGCTLTEAASPLPDEEIVKRVIDGDTALFELLIRRHNQRLYRAIRAILKDDEEAEDAMQEVYVRAFVHLDQFAGDAKLSTWLTKIAIYEALGRLRRRKRIDEMPEISSSENPERATYGRELHTAIESAVDSLPPLYRSVFVLREIEEMTGAETADSLGITEETVKTRLHRARRLMRRRLEHTVGAAMGSAFAFGSRRCDRVTERAMERIRLL
jgi:RNA polymerase sigma-70 factor (ECF subfamily)